jgi:hypothetical protein
MDERISKLLAAVGIGGTSWSSQTTTDLATVEVPEQVFGHRRELLNADARFVWTRWYLASLVDADRILSIKGANYGDVYRAVVAGLRCTTNPDSPELLGSSDKCVGRFM